MGLVNAMEQKIIYYSDELNDEFAGDNIVAKPIDEKYKYLHKNPLKVISKFFWYRIVATPIAYLYMKCALKHKIINKKILKPYKKQGYFVYGNHTHNMADAFNPSMVVFPKDAYLIVHPNNVSIKVIGKITPSLGAIPLPGNAKAMKNFNKCIEKRIKQKHVVFIYPEAHIWPFYTKIRPFTNMSFSYPISYNVPTFAMTNVYKKRKNGKPKMVTYVDGPFFADEGLSMKDARQNLRDKVYNQMVLRSKENDIEYIKYIYKEKGND